MRRIPFKFFSADLNEVVVRQSKYGDPRKTFLITFLIIMLLGIFVFSLLKEEKIKDKSEEFMVYYPKNTVVYFDVYGKSKVDNLEKFNEFFMKMTFGENSLSLRMKKILFQTFDDKFSFGAWNHKRGRTFMFVVPLKRESTVEELFVNLSNNEKISYKVKSGYKLAILGNEKLFYAIHKNYLLISNDDDTIVKSINIKKSDSLIAEKKVMDNLLKLSSFRDGTLVVNNINELVENVNVEKYFQICPEFNDIVQNVVSSVSFKKDKIVIDYYARTALSDRYKNAEENKFEFKYAPPNTVAYININDFKSFADTILDYKRIKYKEANLIFKEVLKMDIEKDLLNPLKAGIGVAIIDTGYPKAEMAVVFKTSGQSDILIEKIINIFKNFTNVEIKRQKYKFKKIEFNHLNIAAFDENIFYGKLDKTFYVVGERNAVKYLTMSYLDKNDNFIKQFPPEKTEQVSVYVDNKNIKELATNHFRLVSRKIDTDELRNSADIIFTTFKVEENNLVGTAVLKIK